MIKHIATASGPTEDYIDIIKDYVGPDYVPAIVRQETLAGPNDNVQFILDWVEIVKLVAAVGLAELVREIVKDGYKNKAHLFGQVEKGLGLAIRGMLHAIQYVVTDRADKYISVLIGIENKEFKEGDRNICWQVNSKGYDAVLEGIVVIAAFHENLLMEMRRIKLSYQTDGENIIWDQNGDGSIRVEVYKNELSVKYYTCSGPNGPVTRKITVGPMENISENFNGRQHGKGV